LHDQQKPSQLSKCWYQGIAQSTRKTYQSGRASKCDLPDPTANKLICRNVYHLQGDNLCVIVLTSAGVISNHIFITIKGSWGTLGGNLGTTFAVYKRHCAKP